MRKGKKISPVARVTGAVGLELAGRELLVRGHRGVLEYDTETVSLAMERSVLRVSGSGLTISALSKCDAAISGDIRAVEFI